MIIGKRGIRRIGEYYGYNPSIDATISNVFAASAFRFGHTMVNSVLTRLNENFEVITEGNLPLRNAFFAPWRIVQEGGVDPILRGLFSTATKLNTPAQVRRVNAKYVWSLTIEIFTYIYFSILNINSQQDSISQKVIRN